MNLYRVRLHRRTYPDGSVGISLRYFDQRPGETLVKDDEGRVTYPAVRSEIYEQIIRTEPNPTKTRMRWWDREAATAAWERQKELNADSRDAMSACRIDKAMNAYVMHCQATKASGTVENTERMLARFMDFMSFRQFNVKNLSGVSVTHLAQWRNELLERGLSASTVNLYLSVLSSWFKWAIGESMCRRNPAKDVNKAKTIQTDKQLSIQSPADLWRILDALEYDTRAATIGLLATSGLRIGEAAALTWDGSWDAEKDVLWVGQPDTETKKHRRTIPVCDLLRRWLMVLKLNNTEGPWITGNLQGTIRLSSQPKAWLAPFGVSPHDFRRFFRSGMETIGCPVQFLDDLLGHRTDKTRVAYTNPVNMEGTRPYLDKLSTWILAAKPKP